MSAFVGLSPERRGDCEEGESDREAWQQGGCPPVPAFLLVSASSPSFSQRTHSGLDTRLGDWYCPGSWRKTSWSLGPCLLLSSAPCPTDPLPYFFKPLSLLPSDFVLFMSSPDSAVCVLPEGSDVGRGQKRGNPADITAH